MDISTIILAAIAIVAALGAITGYFGKSRGETVIALLKEEIEHYIRENGQLKEENAALRSSDENKSSQIVTLTKLAQGSPQLAKLTTEIRELIKLIRERS